MSYFRGAAAREPTFSLLVQTMRWELLPLMFLIHFFNVVKSGIQNELILSAVLDGGFEAISSLLHDQLDQRSLMDNLELVLLALDELIDTGVILEIDPKAIKNRVLMMDATASDPALGDMTIGEAFEKAKAQAKSGGWLSGWGRSSEG
jgi:hypothetical protein